MLGLLSCGGWNHRHPDAIRGAGASSPWLQQGNAGREMQAGEMELWGRVDSRASAQADKGAVPALSQMSQHLLMLESLMSSQARCFSFHLLFNFISTKALKERPNSQRTTPSLLIGAGMQVVPSPALPRLWGIPAGVG